MSKQQVTFKLVAFTDAAGKYDSAAYRSGNEDNFYVDDDLSDNLISHCIPDKLTTLSELGMLMAVADGMGGMNAGEVASQIAIDTVKFFFSPNKINKEIAESHNKRANYLERTIKAADKNIKDDARNNPEHKGMGSTILLAWLWNNELTISWCGDSRAYIFNQKSGIQLISEDHSYVQDLVNKGLLTYEQTFDHPQNNIVTRSLGDPNKEACPDSRCYFVAKGDIILLCSDGLSGVLRDKKTYDNEGNLLCEDNIEDILRVNDTSMKECRKALWRAAERADWYDNVTVILCKITDGDERTLALHPITKANLLHRQIRLIYFLLMVPIIIILTLATNYFVKDIHFIHSGETQEFPINTDSIQIKRNKIEASKEKEQEYKRQEQVHQKSMKSNDQKEENCSTINKVKVQKETQINKEKIKKENETLTVVKESSSPIQDNKLTKIKQVQNKEERRPAEKRTKSSPNKSKSNQNN